MIPASFESLLLGVAGVDGALIGLLFVAVSVVPGRLHDPASSHMAVTQAATALGVFVNALALSLLGLLPGVHMAVACAVAAATILFYGLAVGRIAVRRWRIDRRVGTGLARIAALVVGLAAVEIVASVEFAVAPDATGGPYLLATALIVALLSGISRAWELVGFRDIGLIHSLRLLSRPESVVAEPDRETDR